MHKLSLSGILLCSVLLAAATGWADSQGTGFVVSPDGYLLTCHHVIADAVGGAGKIQMTIAGRSYAATIAADDRDHDLALLQIEARGLVSLGLVDSDKVEPGADVWAVGFPLAQVLGTGAKVTRGTIAGIATQEGKRVFETDAIVNPGNSGGPLVNEFGLVVGVVDAKLKWEREWTSVGFAVPINYAKTMLRDKSVAFSAEGATTKLGGPELFKRVSPAVALIIVSPNRGSSGSGSGPVTPPVTHIGPSLAPGITPSKLGWGPDDRPYPDKFVVNPKDGAEMAWVPPGEFTMGSPAAEQDYAFAWAQKAFGDAAKRPWFNSEGPQHKVRITKGFWLYRHAVTNARYRRFRADHKSGEFKGLSLDADKQPVVQVSWNEARDYCQWAGMRLPTEAEWEYACRAGTQTRFWWGDSERYAGKYANVADRTLRDKLHLQNGGRDWPVFDTDDGQAVSAPVGSYQANAFGLYDMLGNVTQWCADWSGEGYYASSPRDDPTGPTTGKARAARGGSWFISPAGSRSAARLGGLDPDTRNGYLGFRCARTP